MKRIVLSLAMCLWCCLWVDAQHWRIGITGGATYNHYSIDTHYMSDWHYHDAWGRMAIGGHWRDIGTLGVMGQYDFNDWLGVRVDLNWTQKDYRRYRTMIETDYKVRNRYLQLPVMASFSFGGSKVKGFLNVGVYGAYWQDSKSVGKWEFLVSDIQTEGTYQNDFNEGRDQRLDYGIVGGMGVEWRFHFLKQDWAWQIMEARVYYSTRSSQKKYMNIKDHRYNTTIALQSGLCYFF